jgi:hypothetical protein
MAKEQARRDAQQAELLLEARVAVFDTKKAELVAQKILAQHSTRMKVALSELAVQTAEDLRSQEVRPKDRALAMVALKTVSNQLYGWDREPDIQRMELARTGDQTKVKSYYQHWREGTEPPECTGAVNLALINTTPQQLAEMAESEENRDDQSDACATERNGLSMGPSAIAAEQPPAATHGCPIPEKEAPPSPVKEPAPSSRTVSRDTAALLLAPKQPVQDEPPSSPAVRELAARREAFERARAEHRKNLWEREKYR